MLGTGSAISKETKLLTKSRGRQVNFPKRLVNKGFKPKLLKNF
jgi:hypothetical protein